MPTQNLLDEIIRLHPLNHAPVERKVTSGNRPTNQAKLR
jgi:hypothetical protein